MTEVYVPEIVNHAPHIRGSWPKATLNLLAAEVQKQFHVGTSAIEIVPAASPAATPNQEITVGVGQMRPGEGEIAARRPREVFVSIKV